MTHSRKILINIVIQTKMKFNFPQKEIVRKLFTVSKTTLVNSTNIFLVTRLLVKITNFVETKISSTTIK